jgi:hypothetical protein
MAFAFLLRYLKSRPKTSQTERSKGQKNHTKFICACATKSSHQLKFQSAGAGACQSVCLTNEGCEIAVFGR